MKIANKRELLQIAINLSSDSDFKSFINLYQKCAAKPYSFCLNNTTLVSDNSLPFRRRFLERI